MDDDDDIYNDNDFNGDILARTMMMIFTIMVILMGTMMIIFKMTMIILTVMTMIMISMLAVSVIV